MRYCNVEGDSKVVHGQDIGRLYLLGVKYDNLGVMGDNYSNC
jgi:hypothetical protein